MSRFRLLEMQMLDKHLAQVKIAEVPSEGWIHAIRQAIGMSTRQLANIMGVAKQSVTRLEKNEVDNSITLKSLRKTAEALDCKLVYVFVPNEGSIGATVRKQALKKAAKITKAVDHTMMLEGQRVAGVNERTKQLAEELVQNINSNFWDE